MRPQLSYGGLGRRYIGGNCWRTLLGKWEDKNQTSYKKWSCAISVCICMCASILTHLILFEFAFSRCASNANWIHINRVHTAKILKLPTAAQVAISTLGLWSQHSRCIETHTKVRPIVCLTLSLVVDNVERTWISTNYTRPLGKWSLCRQHLVSSVPAW